MQTVYLQMAIPVYTMRSLRPGMQKGYYDRKNKAKCGTRPYLHAVPPRGPGRTATFVLLTKSANKNRLLTFYEAHYLITFSNKFLGRLLTP